MILKLKAFSVHIIDLCDRFAILDGTGNFHVMPILDKETR